jgi:hypothetical protein
MVDCLYPKGFSALRLISWRRDRRNSRLGFASVELATASGPLQIDDVIVSQNNGTRFVSMPAGSYISGGQAKYKAVLKWPGDIDRFRDDVIALIEQLDPKAFESDELAHV